MKHSIRGKLTVLVVGLIAGCILACIILNMVFLNRYYNSGKLNDLEVVYENVCSVLESDNTISETERLMITAACDRYGVALLISGSSDEKVYTYGDPTNIMSKRLTESMQSYGGGNIDGYVVERGDGYIVIQHYDSSLKVNYYELY